MQCTLSARIKEKAERTGSSMAVLACESSLPSRGGMQETSSHSSQTHDEVNVLENSQGFFLNGIL